MLPARTLLSRRRRWRNRRRVRRLASARTIYNYMRDHDPQTGRYVESDPIGLIGGLNTYAYAVNNPLKYIDANGLDSYSGENFAGTSWPAFPKKPPDPSQCGCSWRWPDFVTFQLDFYVGSTSLTATRYGDVFWGKGFSRQYQNPFAIGISLSDGWLLKCNPTQQDVNDFLIGWAASVGGYRGFGGSFSINSSGKALNLGVGAAAQADFFASPGVINSYLGNIFDE
jgi:RHS repeat-associated protein